MLSRRQFIKAGVAGTAALVVARVIYGPFEAAPAWQSGSVHQFTKLSDASRGLIAALAGVVLDGAMPADADARAKAVEEVVVGVDKAVAALQPAVQAELQQLFALLNFPISRRLLAGVSQSWLKAPAGEIGAFLENWRDSRFTLLRSGFHGLHQLILAAWYGCPDAWAAIGYAQPAHVLAAQQAN